MKWLVLVLVLGACGGKSPAVEDPGYDVEEPDPEKPKPKPVAPAEKPLRKDPDCAPTVEADESPAMPYVQRSVDEGKNAAKEGQMKSRLSQGAEVDRETREQYTRDASKDLNNALLADPYNVMATYELAGIYARVGGRQCALNMLTRLVQMRSMRSVKDEVEKKIDRLLGRRNALDPDFSDLRADDAFRTVVRAITASTALHDAPKTTPGVVTVEVQRPKKLPRVPDVDDGPAPKPAPPERPERPETQRVTVKVSEVRPSGGGLALKLDCGGRRIVVGMKGVIVGPKGAISGGGVTVSTVKSKECTASSTLALDKFPANAAVVFEVPVVE